MHTTSLGSGADPTAEHNGGVIMLRDRAFPGRLAGFWLLLAGLLVFSTPLPAAAAVAGPSDLIRQFYGQLLDTMQRAATLGAKGRYQRLEPIVFGTFDVPFMAKLSIGPSWAGLTPEQKQRAAKAYGRYLAAVYASRFDSYAGERLEVLGEQKIRRGTLVKSRIIKSDGEPVAIDYMVHDNAVGYQVRDVYVTGSISELATRRSDFAAILRNNGIDGLIAMLNKKADDLGS
jgi:phospholipid transport system substrate-binding protein